MALLGTLSAVFSQTTGTQDNYIISSRVYSVEDGLASREVFCATQDDDGFMWLGTRNGLNRFDGREFKHYSRQSHGLYSNRIIQLAKYGSEHLVLLHGNFPGGRLGMYAEAFDLKTGKAQHLKSLFPDLPFEPAHILYVANDGRDVYFFVRNPFALWVLNEKGFTMRANPQVAHGDESTAMDYNLVPQCWSGSTVMYTFPRYFVHADTLINIKGYEFSQFLEDGSAMLKSPDGRVARVSKEGISTATDVKRWRMVQSEVYADGNLRSRVYYLPQSGLWLWQGEERIHLIPASRISLASPSSVYQYYFDKSGHYWICTSLGLHKVRVERRMFRQYFTQEQIGQVASNQARGITIGPDGRVIANIWHRTAEADSLLKRMIIRDGPGINYGILYANGYLYVGSQIVAKYAHSLRSVPDILFKGLSRDIWSLALANDSLLVIGCDSGVVVGHLGRNRLVPVRYELACDTRAIQPYRFIPVDESRYWVVANNGLFLFYPLRSIITDYYGEFAADTLHRLPPVSLYDALPDGEHAFWLATNGGGLIHFDMKTGKRRFIRKANGLPSDILYRIEPDDIGRLWISTDQGLCCFDPARNTFDNFSTDQGITHNEFNRASSYRAPDGRLFFGGLNGVTAFHPLDFVPGHLQATEPLRIVGFNQFSAAANKLTDKTAELISSGAITLQPGDRFFTLDFVLLDYREGNINYAYRVDGIDNDWNPLSSNSLRISGLPQGKYTLRVRGQNVSGKWSASELEIPVTVVAPVWQRPWFVVFSILCLLAGTYVWYRWRTRQLLQAKQALERTVEKRTTQLKELLGQKDLMMKEIHHRVKNNLQVISGLLELQKARTSDDATRDALEESQNRVISIAFIHQNLYEHEELKGVEMHSFIQDLSKHISSVFASDAKRVDLAIQVDDIRLDIETALPLGLILNELLTNSYKHAFTEATQGEISIELLNTAEGHYRFAYHDNGTMKADPDKSGTSLGMRLIQQLTRQIHGTGSFSYANGYGYTIEFMDLEQRRRLDD